MDNIRCASMDNGASVLSGRIKAQPRSRLWITIRKGMTMSLLTHPSHPGDVLNELYLMPLEMSAITLASHLDVPRTRIERLIKGQTSLTVDTAMRLARFFGTTPEYWMNLQKAWDLARARESIDVSKIKPLEAA